MTARAHTHKKKMFFLKGYYHGDFQWGQKIDYPGILPEEVANNVVVPWFDLQALEDAYNACDGDVAGLIAQPYDHGNFYATAAPPRSIGRLFVSSATITVWFLSLTT